MAHSNFPLLLRIGQKRKDTHPGTSSVTPSHPHTLMRVHTHTQTKHTLWLSWCPHSNLYLHHLTADLSLVAAVGFVFIHIRVGDPRKKKEKHLETKTRQSNNLPKVCTQNREDECLVEKSCFDFLILQILKTTSFMYLNNFYLPWFPSITYHMSYI